VKHRFFILTGALFVVALVYLLMGQPGVPIEARTGATDRHRAAHEEETPRQKADYEKQSRERIAELAKLETEQRLRSQLEATRREGLAELDILLQTKAAAWSTILTSNAQAYQALREQAEASPSKTVPCTLCDGRGLMPFCAVCEHSGKCVYCKGAGRTPFGQVCPICRGSGKCYLCFGTGKMPCLFCDDGIVYLKGPLPPTRMPIPQPVTAPQEPLKMVPAEPGPVVSASPPPRRTPEQPFQQTSPTGAIDGNQIPLAVTLVLFLILGFRTLAPRVANLLSTHFNPWTRVEVASNQCLSRCLPEDEPFSRFVEAFRGGPVPASSGDSSTNAAPVSGSGLFATPDSSQEPSKETKALLASIHKHFQMAGDFMSEIMRTVELGGKRKLLISLSTEVASLKGKASAPELLPIWQMACALEGLVNQLIQKTTNINSSSLSTCAQALDLQGALGMPGLRPDLAITPAARLLVVDDDPVSRKAVSLALKKAFGEPELAANGEAALALTEQHSYDAIFLDVEMPGMDGFELCTKIRNTVLNQNTSVVFVTSHCDFDSRAKSTLVGGQELIAKPFLAFEITLKALTLVLKARFERGSNVPTLNERERPAAVNPAHDFAKMPAETDVAPPHLSRWQSAAPTAPAIHNPNQPITYARNRLHAGNDFSISAPELIRAPVTPPKLSDASRPDPLGLSSGEFAKAFFEHAPSHIQVLRQQLSAARNAAQPAERDELLGALFIGVHTMCAEAGRAQLAAAFRVGSTLESMLKKLLDRPNFCTASRLDTADAGLVTLDQLCQSRADLDLAEPPVHLLVVDDDLVARRAISGALQLAFGRPDNADCGEAALVLAGDKAYDLIFLDVLMPGMDGFAACPRLHQTALNLNTPVVFVTSQDDAYSRSEAAAAGGCGFIPKPVFPSEITLLALAYIVRSRLERRNGEAWMAMPVPLFATSDTCAGR
jgi:CheY-like chemotaxis protein